MGRKMASGPKIPDPRDVEVGKRVRFFRMKAGLSQETVGDALGLTFQQIQKYEKGSNRIAPSRLLGMAKLFKVSVSSFFGGDGRGGSNDFDVALMDTRTRMRIVSLLIEINDEKVEARICDLLEAMRR